MLNVNNANITSPVRQIKGKAELFSSSAIALGGRYVEVENPDITKPITAQLASKNLIDLTKIKYGYELGSVYGTLTTNSSWYVTDWIKVKPSTTYTVSGISSLYRAEVDENFKSVSNSNFERVNTFTTTEKTHYVQFNSEIAGYDKPQLELGTTATPYTPYVDFTQQGYVKGEAIQSLDFHHDGNMNEGFSKVVDIQEYFGRNDKLIFEDGTYWVGSGQTDNEINGTDNHELGEFFSVGDYAYFDGYWLYTATSASVEKYVTVSGKNLLPKNYFYDFYPDRDNDCWIYGLPHGTYTLSGWITKYADDTSTATRLKLVIYYKDGTTNLLFVGMDYDCAESDGIPRFKQGTITTDFTKEIDKVFVSLDYSALNNPNRIAENVMLELGSTATDFVTYQEPTIYEADETGKIENIKAIAPTTVIIPNNNKLSVKAECKVCRCDNTFSYNGDLQQITIDRAGEEGKFFGFGVCQKLNLKLRDTNREKAFTTDNFIKAYFAAGNDDYITNFPNFYITESHRDENTNALSITAYDLIKKAEKHTVAELGLTSYTIKEFAAAAAALFGLTLDIQGVEDFTLFDLEYAEGANFEGTESIRAALTAVAEATQTIYFVTENKLVFKRLAISQAAEITIDKENYISLDSGENRRLQSICNTTELGDATTASISAIGTTQFIRDNPFLELREDIADILDNAIAAVGGTTINQFACTWRGNYLVEIGDKLGLITKDNETVYSYLLNDTISYNGAFSEATQWKYTDSAETPSNPTTLGEALKQTYAKVDKANKQIDIVASEAAANGSAIAALLINTDSINASVEKVERESAGALENVNATVNDFKQQVTAALTAESAKIEVIQEELENGVAKVKTATGYEFSDEGLIIDKTGAETNSKLNESGLTVSKGSQEMLFAGVKDENGTKKAGVFAEDLHATTYLIVGSNSRFENYGNDRTGCFWIGG